MDDRTQFNHPEYMFACYQYNKKTGGSQVFMPSFSPSTNSEPPWHSNFAVFFSYACDYGTGA
jgi:hypothetical protein